MPLRRARRRIVKSNTIRSYSQIPKTQPIFHSLRICKKEDTPVTNGIAKVQTTSEILLKSLENNVTPPEKFQNPPPQTEESNKSTDNKLEEKKAQEDVPSIPDRKFKPKFLNGKFKYKGNEGTASELEDTFVNNDDNESLISGIARLSDSPAPVPAPRKLIFPGLTKNNCNAKHTYQNVPIPISPNNSQDQAPEDEVSFEGFVLKVHLVTDESLVL